MSSSRITSSPRSVTKSLSSQDTSTGSSTVVNRSDLSRILRNILDNISSWKAELQDFGTSYDPLRSKIDALLVRFDCFLEYARMTADKGETLSGDMADVLETISDQSDPTPQIEKSVEGRLRKLKRTCSVMVEECQKCTDKLLEVHDLLSDISKDLDEQDSRLKKETKMSKSKASRARVIANIAKTVGMVASAAAAVTTIFFSMGTSALVIAPVVVSAALPIISYLSNNKSEALNKRIEVRLCENDTVQRITAEASNGTEHVVKMTKWWSTIQQDILTFKSCFKSLEWGSESKLVNSIKDWKALEDRFKEFSDQLNQVSLEPKAQRKSPSSISSVSATSSEASKSSHRKVDMGVPKVRRVDDTIVLSKPRRAIAVTNTPSLRSH
ncbi:hypothetical protein SCHPADRAFT_937818 [Schizopora paradoxa]|uniref:Uncharacterized protein n=1 Tax=Schizopora paradoxa TaxID=27342 RepID=A0A0H2S460_9AGAM|nr:hypothetical protein SCHPADRAFT_937818 [Schizopora paradoxa]